MIIDRHCLFLVALAASAAFSLPVAGAGASVAQPRRDDVAIGACIRQAAGGRSWLEKTLWGLRDQEGGWIGAEILNADGSHDLGPLQVNSWWITRVAQVTRRPRWQVRHWLVNDPCFNVQVARWIFLTGLSIKRDYWKAVGVYHSPTDWRQARYAASVSAHLRHRFGATIFASSPNQK